MAHFAQSPSFILHQVTCPFATGDTLFGPLNLTLDASPCALVGRNGSGKTRLLRLLAGIDEPENGHIERFVTHAYVAQQHDISSQTTLAELLGYDAIFAARKRIDSGDYQPEDLEKLDGNWDLAERLSEAFIHAQLPAFDPDKPAGELSGGERIRALLCGAFTADADYLLLDEPTNHLDRQGREWFYDQLFHHQGGVLVASHDRELLAQVPRILELSLLACAASVETMLIIKLSAIRNSRLPAPRWSTRLLSANESARGCIKSTTTASDVRQKRCVRLIASISPPLSG